MIPTPRYAWLSLLVVALLAGCQREDPLAQTVTAKAPLQFQMWRSHLGDTFNLRQRQEFDTALQEIRLAKMLGGEASGSVAIDTAVREQIDGKSVRAVLALGYEAKWKRLQNECRALDSLLGSMTRVKTNPGDQRSADYLDGRREKHREKAEADRRELAVIEERLKQLLGDAYVPTVDDPEEKPVLIPRGAKA